MLDNFLLHNVMGYFLDQCRLCQGLHVFFCDFSSNPICRFELGHCFTPAMLGWCPSLLLAKWFVESEAVVQWSSWSGWSPISSRRIVIEVITYKCKAKFQFYCHEETLILFFFGFLKQKVSLPLLITTVIESTHVINSTDTWQCTVSIVKRSKTIYVR